MKSPDFGQPEGRNPDTIESEKPIAVDESSYFVVRLGSSLYAFPAEDVDFIGPVEQSTPVPTAPTHIIGISHIRGRILTVVDFSRILQLSSTESADASDKQAYRRFVVLHHNSNTIAIIVDQALGLNLIARTDILNKGQDTKWHDETVKYIEGQFDLAGRIVSILNPRVIFSALVTPATGPIGLA